MTRGYATGAAPTQVGTGATSSRSARLVPRGSGRPLAIFGGVCALVSVLLGLVLRGGRSPSTVDVALAELVRVTFGPATDFSDELAELGKASSVAAAGVLLSVVLAACGRRGFAVLTAASVLAIPLVTHTGKVLSDRALNGELSFPSGHTAGITAVVTVLALFLVAELPPKRRWLAPVAAAVCAVVPLSVGLAVLVEHFHYPTDVIGGWCVGVATTVGLALGLELYWKRREA